MAWADTTLTVVASPYTISHQDSYCTIFADTSGGQVDINLPAAALSKGRVIICKLVAGGGLNHVYLNPQAGEEIDGKTEWHTGVIYEHVAIQCDGSDWWIIA
jgi:hypothetical protein